MKSHSAIIAASDDFASEIDTWGDTSDDLEDFGDDEWRQMICVEAANALRAAVPLEPGQSHTMVATAAVRPL